MNLVCTIVSGEEASSIAQYSVPLMKAYALRIGAEFLILEKTFRTLEYGQEFYEKLQAGDLLSSFERVLYVDADIIILPGAPDLFQATSDEHFGVTVVGSALTSIQNEIDSLLKVFNYAIDPQLYFNAGVFLVSRKQQRIFTETLNDVKEWASAIQNGKVRALHDQSILNYLVQKHQIPISDLGKNFNRTRAFGNFHQRFRSYFIHYAGMSGQRTRLMKLDSRIANNPKMLALLKRSSLLAWLRDKLIAITN